MGNYSSPNWEDSLLRAASFIPSFLYPLGARIDVSSAQVMVRDLKSRKDRTEYLDLLAGVGNGVILEIVENLSTRAPQASVS